MTDLTSFSPLDKGLENFLLLSQLGSFSKVAEYKGQTQPAITKSIKQLEIQLGLQIIDNSQRPVKFTFAGIKLQSALRDYSSQISLAIDEIKDIDSVRQTYRLGFIDSAACLLSTCTCEKLSKVSSGLTIITGPSNLLLRRLLENQLDYIVVSDSFGEENRVLRRPLLEEKWMIALPPQLSGIQVLNWQSVIFSGIPFIHSPDQSGDGRFIEKLLSILPYRLPNYLSTNSNEVLISLIMAGKGWSIVKPTTIAQTGHRLSREQLRHLPETEEITSSRFWLMTRKGENPSLSTNRLSRIFKDCLKEWRDNTFTKFYKDTPRITIFEN